MHDDRFSDDYPDDSQFYDGEEDPGTSYPTIFDTPRSGGFASDILLGRKVAPQIEESPPTLMTPEEFIARFGYGGEKVR
jgi:hypothetical protein